MPNHTNLFLTGKIFLEGPVITTISQKAILPTPYKKNIVVQSIISLEGIQSTYIHEEKFRSMPLNGLENTFIVQLDDEVITTSTTSDTLLYPPGFEPNQADTKDDASSHMDSVSGCNTLHIVPKKLLREYKRLGIQVQDISIVGVTPRR